MKNPFLYYLFGSILCISSALIIFIFLLLPSLVPEYSFMGWISFGVTIVFIIVFIYGIYLLKKGNFIKLNKNTDLINKKIEDELLKKEKELKQNHDLDE